MRVFVVNCGSSSLKYRLVDTTAGTAVAAGREGLRVAERGGGRGRLLLRLPREEGLSRNLRPEGPSVQPKRGRRWLTTFAALLGAAAASVAAAQEAERFEVRNAYVELVNGEWLLDVRLDLALADAARQAFAEGVPLLACELDMRKLVVIG